jgi:hypothetical protein
MMSRSFRGFPELAVLVFCLALAGSAAAGTLKCGPDSVKTGNACIDKYEASVWNVPTGNTSLIKKIQSGKATLDDLTAGGATQLSPSPSCSPAFPSGFPLDGNWTPVFGTDPPTPGVYAVSIPGVPPTACVSWFQANQACALLGEAAPPQRRVAAGGGRRAGSGERRRQLYDLRHEFRRPRQHGRPDELQIQLGRLRHGGERVGVGGRLGGPGEQLHGLDDTDRNRRRRPELLRGSGRLGVPEHSGRVDPRR